LAYLAVYFNLTAKNAKVYKYDTKIDKKTSAY